MHLTQSDLTQARRLIAAELDWLYGLGVRQITPIHLTNNAFGGTAIYMRFLDALNVIVTGRHYEVEDGWESGIRYRLDYDGGLAGGVQRAVVSAGPKLSPRPAMNRRSLMYDMPGVEDVAKSAAPEFQGRGHVNIRGLSVYGLILLEEMRARGMIIDVDHMSQKSLDVSLDLMERADYPVISSHSWFRELAFSADAEFDPENPSDYGTADVHKVAHENAKRGDQVERIARLGGVIAPDPQPGRCGGIVRGHAALAEQGPASMLRLGNVVGRSLPLRGGKDRRSWRRHRQRYQRGGRPARPALRAAGCLRAAHRCRPRGRPAAADRRAAQWRPLRRTDSGLSVVPLRRERPGRVRRARMRCLGRHRRVQGRFQPLDG